MLGNVTTDTGFHGYSMITSTMNIGNSVGYQISIRNQDLFAQQYNSTGPNGTLYPLLHPIGFVSTSQLTSTIDGLGILGYISTSQLISTVTGLGTLYVSSSQLLSTTISLENMFISALNFTFPSTINGLANVSYISTQSLISTTTALQNFTQSNINSTTLGLAALGYISTQSLVSTTTGLQNIINSTINNVTLGKMLRVDSIFGNDTLAIKNQYNLPFSTISTAMYCASTQDQIWVLPGTYNEKVIFKSGVNIRGANLNSVTIQQANVTQSTILIQMTQSNRLEDVTLNLTSKVPTASTLIGVLFSSCQDTCKLRACVLNVNNSEITANGITNLYGIYSSGHSSTFNTSSDNIQRTSMTVTSAGAGKACCVYNDDSNRVSMRDVNLLCTDALNAVYTNGKYYCLETANSNSIIQIKSSSVNGNAYNVGNDAQDISQSKGQIIVGFTDLVNRTANNSAFTCVNEQVFYSFGVSGILSNSGGPNGSIWSNSYLLPGTVTFAGGAGQPITNIYNIRNANLSLLTSLGFQSATGVGGTISSFAVLYKNNTPQPQFVVSLTGNETNKFISTSSITLKGSDTFAIYLSTSQSNTAMTYPLITMTLY